MADPSPNPIKDLLYPDASFEQVVKEFPWDDFGISGKYVILFTGRTGSTLITKLIQDTGLCGVPDEFFNPDYIYYALNHVSEPGLLPYLRYLVPKFSRNGIFGVEVDSMRFQWLQEVVDFETGLFDRKTTTYFWLTREDLVSQAYSFARAKNTGFWHHFDDANNPAPTEHAEPTTEQIWQNILLILENEQKVERFLSQSGLRVTRLTYEQLIADKALTLGRMLLEIGVPAAKVIDSLQFENEPVRKLSYTGKTQTLVEFYYRFSDILREIEAKRKFIPIETIKESARSAGVRL